MERHGIPVFRTIAEAKQAYKELLLRVGYDKEGAQEVADDVWSVLEHAQRKIDEERVNRR